MTSYPKIIDDFISDEECKTLLDLAENGTVLFDAMTCGIPRWDKRNIYTQSLLPNHKVVYDIILQVADRIQEKIRYLENDNNIWLEVPMYSRWLPGDHLVPPHADNIEQDGVTPNASPWRSHGIVLYLNDNFDGGEIFYKNHNITMKPKPRICAIHRGGIEDTHGVYEVQNGVRHTIVSFACKDKSHVDKVKNSFLDGYLNRL